MKKYIASLDLGTTSTRFILFDRSGKIVITRQEEHKQIYPEPGWVEHDPEEIWYKTQKVISRVMNDMEIDYTEISGLGITNQRETTLAWNPRNGKVYYNAIVWQDTRTQSYLNTLKQQGHEQFFKETTGLPLASYFSGSKIRWMLENAKGLKEAASRGEVCFGTIDSYILWKLTGGIRGGVFLTDVTNASRTMLMNIKTVEWDDRALEILEVPRHTLPEIVSSIPEEPYGYTTEEGSFGGEVPVCGILGDQQAALFGQSCFAPGDCKNTYGTGAFLLMNTGTEPVYSRFGLVTTLAYRIGSEKPVYALEGSIAIAGSLVQWLRDNLGLIKSSEKVEELAKSVDDNGGVYFVPAFSGLFAPYWNTGARGSLFGLTGYAESGHIARAVLEAAAFQSLDIFEAMSKDSGIPLEKLRVDGGMTVNNLLMQFQSDILNVPVIRPEVRETTALGAAYAAGLTTGFWKDIDELKEHWREDKRWNPAMKSDDRNKRLDKWREAVKRSFNWT